MHLPPWMLPAAFVLLARGIVGIFQKLSTNYISAESTHVWLIVGFLLFEPFVYPGHDLFQYSGRNVLWDLLSGLFSNLGALALFAAFKNGGKASIVCPMTALYPLGVVLLAPLVLHETITRLQGVGDLLRSDSGRAALYVRHLGSGKRVQRVSV